MSYAHAVVWLDHQRATVIDFTVDDRHVVKLASESARQLHRRSGQAGSGRAPDDLAFYDDVVAALGDAREVMVCGPGTAKVAFVHHVGRKHDALSDRIVAVETMDHPSDGELLAFARRSFRRIDALLGDT